MYESVFDDNNDIRWGVLAEKPDWVFGAEMVACKGRSSKFSSKGQLLLSNKWKSLEIVWKRGESFPSGALSHVHTFFYRKIDVSRQFRR